MREGLFREKTVERISSPEQLNDYIRVSNPGVWMVLSSVIVLLIGVCVWGVFGKLETTVTVPAICADGKTYCYVSAETAAELEQGMTVKIGQTEGKVSAIASEPEKVTEEFGDYAMEIGGFQTGEWVYEVTLDLSRKDGIYEARIVTERVAPMSFLLN